MLVKTWPNIRFLRAFDLDALPTMKITYDREVDALYIRFTDTTVTTKYLEDALYLRLDDSAIIESEEVAPGVVLDYNEANQVVGVEMLHMSKRSPDLDLSTLEYITS